MIDMPASLMCLALLGVIAWLVPTDIDSPKPPQS